MVTPEPALCALCGLPLPPGEQMFKHHGYSGPCPKPSSPRDPAPVPPTSSPAGHKARVERLAAHFARSDAGERFAYRPDQHAEDCETFARAVLGYGPAPAAAVRGEADQPAVPVVDRIVLWLHAEADAYAALPYEKQGMADKGWPSTLLHNVANKLAVTFRDAARADLAADAKTIAGLKDELTRMTRDRDLWRERARLHDQMAGKDYWAWQGDGTDHPESLTCPVLISADDLRALLARCAPKPEATP